MNVVARSRYRVALLPSITVLLLCGWLPELASVRTRTTQPGAGPGTGLVDTTTLALSIRGSIVQPLSPGSSGTVDLDFTNTLVTGLTVQKIVVMEDAADAPRTTPLLLCGIDDFFVIQTTATFPLAAKSPKTLTEAGLTPEQLPRVTMRDDA
jgi:hypothetical protein